MKKTLVAVPLLAAVWIYLFSKYAPKVEKSWRVKSSDLKTTKSESQPMVMGLELISECGCGEKVKDFDRQGIAYDEKQHKFRRVCGACLTKHKKQKAESHSNSFGFC